MHSNLKKGLFLVTFLGMTVSPGISVMAADGDTAEAAKMPGVGIEAVLKDFYSQNREIKAEDYLVPENKGGVVAVWVKRAASASAPRASRVVSTPTATNSAPSSR